MVKEIEENNPSQMRNPVITGFLFAIRPFAKQMVQKGMEKGA